MRTFRLFVIFLLSAHCFLPVMAQVSDGSYKAANEDNPTEIIQITATSLGNGITLYTEGRDYKPLNGSYNFEIHGNRRHISGHFAKGLPEGEWTEYMYSDVYKKYNFKNGKLDGKTYTFYDDGSHRNVSTYKDNKRQHFISYFSNGKIEEEKYFDENEKVHGKVVSYNKEGTLVGEAHFEHGTYHGKTMETDDNGYQTIKNYNHGKLEGDYRRSYSGGTKQEEGKYANEGKKNGKWTIWYENGNIKTVEHYSNGKLDGKKLNYFEEGHLQTEEEYANDKRHGKQIIYDETPGVILSESSYADGELDGESRSYYNGELWRESFYKNGTMLREKEYKNGKLNVLRLINNKGEMVDVQEYNSSGKIISRNTAYKKPESIRLKEDASGIIDIEY